MEMNSVGEQVKNSVGYSLLGLECTHVKNESNEILETTDNREINHQHNPNRIPALYYLDSSEIMESFKSVQAFSNDLAQLRMSLTEFNNDQSRLRRHAIQASYKYDHSSLTSTSQKNSNLIEKSIKKAKKRWTPKVDSSWVCLMCNKSDVPPASKKFCKLCYRLHLKKKSKLLVNE